MNQLSDKIVKLKWHFDDPEHVARLRHECREWHHTPFHFGSRAKGRTGGTDCVGFCEGVTSACGLESFNFKRWPSDNSRHVYNAKILLYLRGTFPDPQSKILGARWVEKPEKNLMAGDLVLMKTGKGLWHMCVMLDMAAFMQCAHPDGVTEGTITAPNYSDHVETFFRARAVPLTK